MKKKFSKDLRSLESIFNFISTFTSQNNFDAEMRYMIELVIEELFTNALKYNPDNHNEIQIELKKSAGELTISMVEYDVEPFDLNSKKVYDLSAPLKDRPIGKLGIHFIKNMLDSVGHEYKDRQNKIILTKKLRD